MGQRESGTDQSIQVEYAGKPLASRMRCHWKVRVWDQDGKASAWSDGATWAMGLLKPADWQAKWIGYDAAYQTSSAAAADDQLMNIQGLKWVQVKGGKDGSKSYLRRNDRAAGGT